MRWQKMKCNHDCFNCVYDDCISDEMTLDDYKLARKIERENSVKPKSRYGKERASEYNRKYYEDNLEECRLKVKKYHETHREEDRQRSKNYYENHRAGVLEKARKRKDSMTPEQLEKFKARRREANRKYREKRRMKNENSEVKQSVGV